MQEVLGVYTSPFLDTDELKMALRVWNVSGTFEKRVPRQKILQSIAHQYELLSQH